MNLVKFQKISRIRCSHCKEPVDLTELQPLSKFNCESCGGLLRVPVAFGKYLILKELREDASSVVYRAVDRELHRQVALKVLRTETVVKRPGFNWRQLMKNSLREARMLSSINHTNVLKVFSLGSVEGQPAIEMELIEGRSLLERMRKLQSLPTEAEVLKLGLQIASGLEAAEKAELIHLDLCPSNLRFCKEGQAKLVNFAVDSALVIDGLPEREPRSLNYIAPELILSMEGKMRIGIQADMYSLGAIMFHYLTGHPPFIRQSAEKILEDRYEGPAPRASEFRSNLSPAVVGLIETLMKRDSRKRFQSYRELIDRMVQTLNHVILSEEESIGEANLSQESDSVIALAAAIEDSPRSRNARTIIRKTAVAKSAIKGKPKRSG